MLASLPFRHPRETAQYFPKADLRRVMAQEGERRRERGSSLATKPAWQPAVDGAFLIHNILLFWPFSKKASKKREVCHSSWRHTPPMICARQKRTKQRGEAFACLSNDVGRGRPNSESEHLLSGRKCAFPLPLETAAAEAATTALLSMKPRPSPEKPRDISRASWILTSCSYLLRLR